MQQNKILDIIINLLSGIDNNNSIVEEAEAGRQMTLNGCSYLLNQTLRQYAIQKSHYFISEKAGALWDKISTENILKYTYRDKVVKNTNDIVEIDKYKGGEILDPTKGTVYGCEIWRDKENLIVRGKIAFLGRNQTWLPNKDFKPVDEKQLVPNKPKLK